MKYPKKQHCAHVWQDVISFSSQIPDSNGVSAASSTVARSGC